jgi:hypothetical protein
LQHRTDSKIGRIEVNAIVRRADGTVEDKGIVAIYKPVSIWRRVLDLIRGR